MSMGVSVDARYFKNVKEFLAAAQKVIRALDIGVIVVLPQTELYSLVMFSRKWLLTQV